MCTFLIQLNGDAFIPIRGQVLKDISKCSDGAESDIPLGTPADMRSGTPNATGASPLGRLAPQSPVSRLGFGNEAEFLSSKQ